MQFLEQTAIDYIRLGPDARLVVTLGLLALGAVLFALTNPGYRRLSGRPYLAILALVAIALLAARFLMLGMHFAIAEGTLWMRVLGQCAVHIAIGFVLAYIGAARSVDVAGHRRWAIFAFIPVINIGFGFVPGRVVDNPAKRSYFDGLSGPYGIAVLAVLLFGVIGQWGMLRDAVKAENAEIASEAGSQTALIQSIIATRGLEFAIASLVSGSQPALPARVDEITVLTALTAAGETMVSVYQIEQENWAPSEDFAEFITSANCDAPQFSALLVAGATLTQVYMRPGGALITEISTRQSDC